jgi:hypothetical protein
MLNELYSLSETLSGMTIKTKGWHREYKLIPKVTEKAPCIRIWINADGTVHGFENIDMKIARIIRKYGNNQNSFPAFNIAPLYRITNTSYIKELKSVIKDPARLDSDRVISWCIEDNWRTSIVRKIENSITKIPFELKQRIKRTVKSENSITALIESLGSYTELGGKKFRRELEKVAFSNLQSKENVELTLKLLFHTGNPDARMPEKDSGSLSIILDCMDWGKYGYPIASEPSTEWINDILLKADAGDNSKPYKEGNLDAFGIPLDIKNKPMDSVKLSGFDVTLRAMFHEQRCQYRYNSIDDGSYPIAKLSRSKAASALTYISDIERENITWVKADRDEIFFAYPSKLAAIPIKFAAILKPSTGNENNQTKARFENCMQDFIRAFLGLEPRNKPDNIQIFSIRKMDKARSKVVFTRNFSPEWYIKCSQDWQAGCKNAPSFSFTEMQTPFPLEIADIMNNVWKLNGELATQGKTAVKRFHYYQGIELLVDPKNEQNTRYCLRILLANALGLFTFLGNQLPRTDKSRLQNAEKLYSRAKTTVPKVIALISLLLYKGKYKKEDYMEDAPFLVGQLLKISDELHAMYCQVVRGGDVPPQLVGNSVFVTASETPVKALAVLCQRMAPYISWAKQYRTKNEEKSGLAGWYLSIYGPIAAKLNSLLKNNTQFSEFEKAQVFLGYIADLSKLEKREKESNSDKDSKNMEELQDERN